MPDQYCFSYSFWWTWYETNPTVKTRDAGFMDMDKYWTFFGSLPLVHVIHWWYNQSKAKRSTCGRTYKYYQTASNEVNEFRTVLDMNEKLGSSLHGIAYLMKECNLIDFFLQHHGACPAFSPYDDGRNRLDYAISSLSPLPLYKSVTTFLFFKAYLLIIDV